MGCEGRRRAARPTAAVRDPRRLLRPAAHILWCHGWLARPCLARHLTTGGQAARGTPNRKESCPAPAHLPARRRPSYHSKSNPTPPPASRPLMSPTSSSPKLSGKVALVTGASSGIGKAVAEGLAEDCADVALNYLTAPEGADEAAARIRQLGRKAMLCPVDVSDQAAVE